MKWFIINDKGLQEGPYSLEDLKKQRIKGSSQVWREGMPVWKKAEELNELINILPEVNSLNKNPKRQVNKIKTDGYFLLISGMHLFVLVSRIILSSLFGYNLLIMIFQYLIDLVIPTIVVLCIKNKTYKLFGFIILGIITLIKLYYIYKELFPYGIS